jgi:hypothetical protein
MFCCFKMASHLCYFKFPERKKKIGFHYFFRRHKKILFPTVLFSRRHKKFPFSTFFIFRKHKKFFLFTFLFFRKHKKFFLFTFLFFRRHKKFLFFAFLFSGTPPLFLFVDKLFENRVKIHGYAIGVLLCNAGSITAFCGYVRTVGCLPPYSSLPGKGRAFENVSRN